MRLARSTGRLAGTAIGIALTACIATPPSPQASTQPTGTRASAGSEIQAPTGPVQLATEGIECANDRFAIQVPAGWWYAASGPSACLYFNREPFEIAGFEPTSGVHIEIRWVQGDVGTTGEVVSREDIRIDGKPAVRWEIFTGGEPGGVLPPNLHVYQYVVQLGPLPESGPNLMAQTLSWYEEYLENQQVLDAIMATLRLAG